MERKVKKIKLTKGCEAIVDDQDYEFLMQWKWSASKSDTSFYAMRAEGPRRSQKFLYMHRVIAAAEKGQTVDHIDGNTLNNTRKNLRIVTTRQNSMNARSHRDSASKFKGVYPNGKAGKPWCAGICIKGKRSHLGVFQTEVEAAMAYDYAAKKEFGVHAKLNLEERR